MPIVALPLLVAGLFAIHAFAADSTQKASWNQAMRQMQSVVKEILVEVNRDPSGETGRNRKQLEGNAKRFAELAHTLSSTQLQSVDQDPSVKLLAVLFEAEAKNAYLQLKAGNEVYGRGVLRGITGYCVACHTRSANGVSFGIGADDPQVKKLRLHEQASFLVASRQFEAAFERFEKVVSDPDYAAKNRLAWELAVKNALAIAVRVENNPDRAMAVIERAEAMKQAPAFVREQAKAWKASVAKWKAEAQRELTSEQGWLSEAKRLYALARSEQEYPADHSAHVTYLRASAALHQYLTRYPQGANVDEALYLLGSCYEALDDSVIWELSDFYFQACIQRSPHSEMAQRCFRRYERSVHEGFSGSGGTHIPGEVLGRLRELEALAAPQGVHARP
jgi:TolA-binding protein